MYILYICTIWTKFSFVRPSCLQTTSDPGHRSALEMAGLDLDTGGAFPTTGKQDHHSKIRKLCTQISGKFNADKLLKELALLKNMATPEHWTFTSPGVMIARAMIIFLIGLCCWKKWCLSQNVSQPMAYYAPSAPPAPMVFSMNKEPIRN